MTFARKETMTQAHARLLAEARRRLALIEKALEVSANEQAPDWGDVGSLGEVVELIGQAGHYAGVPELTEK